jgi:hypothetical protein
VHAELVLPSADLLATLKVVLAIAAPTVAIGTAVWKLGKRFRPSFQAEIDPKHQGMRLYVHNKGRRKGQITLVAAVDGGDVELPAQFAGLPDGKFHSAWLGGKEKRHLIINAFKESGPFPPGVRILVQSGKDGKERLPPASAPYAIHGLKSDWPPPESGGDADQ